MNPQHKTTKSGNIKKILILAVIVLVSLIPVLVRKLKTRHGEGLDLS